MPGRLAPIAYVHRARPGMWASPSVLCVECATRRYPDLPADGVAYEDRLRDGVGLVPTVIYEGTEWWAFTSPADQTPRGEEALLVCTDCATVIERAMVPNTCPDCGCECGADCPCTPRYQCNVCGCGGPPPTCDECGCECADCSCAASVCAECDCGAPSDEDRDDNCRCDACSAAVAWQPGDDEDGPEAEEETR